MALVGNKNDPHRNGLGYPDPTAYKALKRVSVDPPRDIDEDEQRFQKLLHTIFNVCDLADFRIEGRVVLVDKKTGKVWR
jgi:hypothetical protein